MPASACFLTCRAGAGDQPRRLVRFVRAAILQVAIGRQIGRRGDHTRILDDLVGADMTTAVDVRQSEAGRRQRLEAETGEQPSGARIPWVGDDERTRLVVQRAECGRLFRVCAHVWVLLAILASLGDARVSRWCRRYVQCII